MVPLDRTEHPGPRPAVSTTAPALPDFGNSREIRCPFQYPVRVMMSAVDMFAWSKTTSSASCLLPQEQVMAS